MFLPTTRKEMEKLGWDELDVVLVTGDSYIDSPFIGVAIIGKVLIQAGFHVGIIAQPDVNSPDDISRLGEPELFWGVSAGSIDSMVANYTSLKKRRKTDDYTPGGINNRRPDRAAIAYTNLIKRYFHSRKPVVLGGIEASLRRIAHYDYWADEVRRSVLFDAKADYLLYGMAEKAVLHLANSLKNQTDAHDVRGLCYITSKISQKEEKFLELPAFETVQQDKQAFIDMFHAFYGNTDPVTAKGLYQRHGDRYLVQNPPAFPLTQEELDEVYSLDFERTQHPYYERQGKVRALETVKFSITTHRGCYGECNFCAIAVHEGRTVQWRSEKSILVEARKLTQFPDFKGYIFDLGGPTANMYGFECEKKLLQGSCLDKKCLYPQICPSLIVDHRRQIELLRKIRSIAGVKKVFVASGIRHDLVLNDKEYGMQYLQEITAHHVSGQLKLAPEHSVDRVLKKMGKPPVASVLKFKKIFDEMSKKAGKKQFLTYYFIAAHPGCTEEDMRSLKRFTSRELKMNPEQLQVFLPAPSTYSALMYYTETDPFTGQSLFVEKDMRSKERQKDLVIDKG